VVVVPVILGLWALGGCSSQIPQELTSVPEVKPEVRADGLGEVSGQDLSVRSPKWSVYRTPASEDGPRLRIERLDGGGGTWLSERKIVDGSSTKPESTATLRINGGALELLSTREPGDGVVTEMVPSMLIVPVALKPGESAKAEFEMIVRPQDEPSKVKTRGPASVELLHLGIEKISTPVGEFSCARIRRTLRATLGTGATAAKVTSVTESWHDLGPTRAGMVRERESVRVTVLGVGVRSSDVTWELEDYAGRAGK
jgi:hypothetical protein